MRIHLYLDEDALDDHLVQALRRRGVDVITASEAGLRHRPDAEHLAHAAAQGCALYSFNTGDYHALHTEYLTQGMSHAGIILARQQRYSIGEQMRRLLRLIHTVTAEEMSNRIEFLSAWG
jgi:hypothetical protein